MGYYDSVKDSVKENNENSAGEGSFDTLKESAEKNTRSDEEKGDDTPIEVVEEGGIKNEPPKKQRNTEKREEKKESESEPSASNPFTSGSEETDLSGVEERLDEIIEQNRRMIEILESFGN